ncbi:MAG: ABC transporter permease [Ignavibacteria bacterium]|jgi:putative ABC transport system permease protein
MFKNYIIIAIRNLLKHKFYSILNLTGLAVGIACCILIMLFVQDELSYDKFNKKADRIYRIHSDLKLGENEFRATYMGAPVAKTLVADYPEVEDAFRFRQAGTWFIKYGDKVVKETGMIFADSNMFNFFDIPLLKGNPETALAKPNAVVISLKMAEKIFGNEDPLGKTVILDNKYDYEITGVFDKVPNNSHFKYEGFASLTTLEQSRNNFWLNMNFQTYVLLKPGVDYKQLESKFPGMVEKYIGPEMEQLIGKSLSQLEEEGNRAGFFLQPLLDIHLHSDLQGEIGVNGDIKYVYLFTSIAFFILLIACINFMNLSTARSANRAKEVGLRKVVGSQRGQLIWQFLTESMILSLIALAIAIGLIYLSLPLFNSLSGKEISLSFSGNMPLLLTMFGVIMFVGLLAGSYPALFISAFKPVEVLKGKLKMGAKSGFLRSSLVVFQFAASIIMIIGTTVVYNQLQYVQNKKLGYNKEQALIVRDAFILGDKVQTFKDELVKNDEIITGSVSDFLPTPSNRSKSMVFPEGQPSDDNSTPVSTWGVDMDYIKTMGMEIVKGRDFNKEFIADSKTAIINETLAKQFGWTDPIGKKISKYEGSKPVMGTYRIIGVVKDFHFESLKNEIGPLVFFIENRTGAVSFRFKGNNVASVLDLVRNKWDEFASGQPFEYTFLDDEFAGMYKEEQKLGKIFRLFAVLAIFVGSLGLFGLSAFTAEQRTKEIGVRKVLGASVGGIVILLSKEFIKLIFISFIIAVPIAYYYMNGWLQDFAYRTEIGIITLAFAGLSALLIALMTVSYHAVKIAVTNPTKSLRYE